MIQNRKLQLRVILASYVAAGMLGSFMLGIGISDNKIKNAKIDLVVAEGKLEVAKVRVLELRARSMDRDTIELGLRECLAGQARVMEEVEGVRWQMKVVMDTCPDRPRPPMLPRP